MITFLSKNTYNDKFKLVTLQLLREITRSLTLQFYRLLLNVVDHPHEVLTDFIKGKKLSIKLIENPLFTVLPSRSHFCFKKSFSKKSIFLLLLRPCNK